LIVFCAPTKQGVNLQEKLFCPVDNLFTSLG